MLETSEDLGSSDRTLRNMYFQSLLNGGLSYLLCGVMLASVLLVAYAKLKSYAPAGHAKSPPPPPPLPPPLVLRLPRAPVPRTVSPVVVVATAPAAAPGR